MVVALETGGRWSDEAMTFVSELAAARAREAPKYLRRPTRLAWTRRWVRMLSIACGRAFAASLLHAASDDAVEGPPPTLPELLQGSAGTAVAA